MAATDKIKVTVELDPSQLQRGTKQAQADLGRLNKAALGLASSFGLVFGVAMVKQIGQATIEMAKFAESARLTEKTFSNLAKRVGTTADAEMRKLRQATGGLITDLEVMQRVGAAVDAGMTFEQSRIALQFLQRYSMAFGKDLNQLVSTIFTGLQRGSTLLLDDVGIIISATDEMFKGMADGEKKVALVNKAIDIMKQKMKDLPEVSDGATKQFALMNQELEKMKLLMGDLAQGPGVELIKVFNRLLQNTQGWWQYAQSIDWEATFKSKEFWFGVGGYATVPKMDAVSGAATDPRRQPGMSGPFGTVPAVPLQIEKTYSGKGYMGGGGLDQGNQLANLPSQLNVFNKELDRMGRSLKGTATSAGHAATEEEKLIFQTNEQRLVLQFAVEAANRAKTAQAAHNQQMQTLASALDRLAPGMGNFVASMQSLQDGQYLAAGIQAFNGLLDVIGVTSQDTKGLERAMKSMAAELRKAQDAATATVSQRFGNSLPFREMQKEILQPFQTVWGALQDQLGGSQWEQMYQFINALGSVGQDVSYWKGNQQRIKALEDQLKRDLPELFDAIGASGYSLEEYLNRLSVAFGTDSTFQELGGALFDVQDAITSLVESAVHGADMLEPARKSISSYFQGERMAAMFKARDQMMARGGTPFGQGDVLGELKGSLDAITAAEQAALLRLKETGAGGTAYAGSTDTTASDAAIKLAIEGSITPIEIDDFQDVIVMPGPGGQIRMGWADAVHLDRMEISHWWDVVDGTALNAAIPLKRLWADAVHLSRREVTHWWDIVDGDTLNAAIPMKRTWEQAVSLSRRKVNFWWDIIDGAALNEAVPLQRKWSDAVALSKMVLDDWSDLFTGPIISRAKDPMNFTGGIPGVATATSDAFRVSRLTLDDWSDLFTGSIISRGKTPMNFTGGVEGFLQASSDAFRITRLSLNNWSALFTGNILSGTVAPLQFDVADMVSLSGGISPMELNPNAIFAWNAEELLATDAGHILDGTSPLMKSAVGFNMNPFIFLDPNAIFAWNQEEKLTTDAGFIFDTTSPLIKNAIGFSTDPLVYLNPNTVFKWDAMQKLGTDAWTILDGFSPLIQAAYGYAGPIIQLAPARIFTLGGEKIRVEPEDIFDMDSLENMVVNIVNNAFNNRRIDNPGTTLSRGLAG